MHSRWWILTAVLLIVAAMAAAAQTRVVAGTAPVATYVAMGSSFAAGPGIGNRAAGSPRQCAQSAENYARLFAHKRGLVLKDVSCSGATTENMLHGGRHLPPQLEAVGPATRLVTVTIGGNDVGFIRNLYGWSCANAPRRTVASWRGICSVMPDEQVETAFAGLEEHLRAIVEGIHQRAPAARVVFVDYIAIVPAEGFCSDKLPLTPSELEVARDVAARLAEATEKAAHAAGAEVLKASKLSAEHDVCSADPWSTGYIFQGKPGDFAPIAYHPNAEAMHAIAARLEELVPAALVAKGPENSKHPRVYHQ